MIKPFSERQIEKICDDEIIDLIIDTIKIGKQILVFVSSKANAQRFAKKICENILKYKILVQNENELEEISKQILNSIENPTIQCKELSQYSSKGICFHHSGLLSKQRNLIEGGFRDGFIKVICATPTLAAGINLPAYKVILKEYKRYTSRGYLDIPVLEYHQMAGRAGRPGHKNMGICVTKTNNEDEKEKIIDKYIYGEPEEISSKLAVEPVLKMYLLSLISTQITNTKEDIFGFFRKTLYFYQFRDERVLFENIERILEILKKQNFIIYEEGFYFATLIGTKVSKLYINPDTAHHILSNFDKVGSLITNYFSSSKQLFLLFEFLLNTLECKPNFRVYKNEEHNYFKIANEYEDLFIVKYDPYSVKYEDFLASIKTSKALVDWLDECDENFILEKYKITPGELKYKCETLDWLLYCIEEFSLLRKNFFLNNFFKNLRKRLKLGIRFELLSLTSIKGIGKKRARKLYDKNIKNIQDLVNSNPQSLEKILGEKTTKKILELLKQENEHLNNENLKPKNIRIRNVYEEEIEELLLNDKIYEDVKITKNRNLDEFF